jgi:hypothetical protein
VSTPHTRNVALEGGLYGQGDDARRIEELFSQLEGEWPRLRAALIESNVLSREERDLVSLFIGLQIARAPDRLKQIELVEDIERFTGTSQPTRVQVAQFLRERHLGFDPEDREVEAVWTYATAFDNMFAGQPKLTRLDSIGMALNSAITELSPRISARSWLVRSCRKRILVTTDRPVTNWTRPGVGDQIRGVGLEGAEEVRLPIGPQHLLVLKKSGPSLSRQQVEPRDFYGANLDAVARCANAVIASPHRSRYLADLELKEFGPKLRFNIGPGFRKLSDGSTQEIGDIIHMFTPRS